MSPWFGLGEQRRTGHQAQNSRLRGDPGVEGGREFFFLLRAGCWPLQVTAGEEFEIVAPWRVGRKGINQQIEGRELIGVLQVRTIVEDDRLKNGGKNLQWTNLSSSAQLAEARIFLRDVGEA